MSASIQTAIAGKPTLVGVSRDDLRSGDVVRMTASDGSHATFLWNIVHAPRSVDGVPSAAVLSAEGGPGPVEFTVDNEGTYLVRLIVDSSLPTQDEQILALSFRTVFGGLRLIAAGEKRTAQGSTPTDVGNDGWARDNNRNLQVLLNLVKKVSTSGRVLTVDANRGKDSSNLPNAVEEGYADFSSIQDAINFASTFTPPLSAQNPVTISIFPGLYEEDLSIPDHVHLRGVYHASPDEDGSGVLVRTSASEVIVDEFSSICGIVLEGSVGSTDAVLSKTGSGAALLDCVSVVQNGNSVSQGPSIFLEEGHLEVRRSAVISNNTSANRLAFLQDGPGTTSSWLDCVIRGPSAVDLSSTATEAEFRNCDMESTRVSSSAFGIRTSADVLSLEYCSLSVSGSGRSLVVHPAGGVKIGNVSVHVRWSQLPGGISFNTTGISGSTSLGIGSSEYSALSVSGSLTDFDALTSGSTVAYDNSVSGVDSHTVQDALDSLFIQEGKTISESPYTVVDGDTYIGVDTSSGPVTINLPSGSPRGRRLTIKDEAGQASINNILLQVVDGGKVDGAPILVLIQDYASVSLRSNGGSGLDTVWLVT